jgi:hypothetical protein
MVALAQYIPNDPEEKASVLAVLREHPEVQDFIVRASEKAEQLFPEYSVVLDTVRYDEWDPPMRMQVQVKDRDLATFDRHYHSYAHWLAHEADYPQEWIAVLPLWRGPVGSSR